MNREQTLFNHTQCFNRGQWDWVHFLIASPEKALCDYICYHKVTLRFMKEVGTFLEEDMRFDTDIIPDLNLEIIRKCAETGRKSNTLSTLLKFLKYDRHI